MLGVFLYIFEVKKELLVCFSLSLLYITYYLVEVVKKPTLICRKGEFRQILEDNVPLLNELYWPTPWCVESRLQTVLGSVLRSHLLPSINYRRYSVNNVYNTSFIMLSNAGTSATTSGMKLWHLSCVTIERASGNLSYGTIEKVLRLSDGGQVALDWAEAEGAGAAGSRPVLLVLPGLTGGAQADYVRCLVAAAARLGADAVVFNNRGLGGLPLTTPRLYCAVSHADLAEVVEAVRPRDAPLLAVGVSLGGLILGHYLAEHASRAAVALRAALVVSSPLDVVRGAECIERPPLNSLLSWHMARNLRNTVNSHSPLRRGPGDWAAMERCRSVRQFDQAFTTKHFGFPSVDDYYRAATLCDKLDRVSVPLLCLCAADDPFQPLDVLPLAEAERSPCVALAVTARGGHIGFLEGWWPAPPARAPHAQYIARLAHQYFAALLAAPPPVPAPARAH